MVPLYGLSLKIIYLLTFLKTTDREIPTFTQLNLDVWQKSWIVMYLQTFLLTRVTQSYSLLECTAYSWAKTVWASACERYIFDWFGFFAWLKLGQSKGEGKVDSAD